MAPLYSTVLEDNPPTTASGTPYNVEVLNFCFKKFLREFDFENDLNCVKCATLLICGEDDWINDPLHTKLMACYIQKSTLHIFKNCGHFAEVDQPEKFHDAIDKFFLD